MTTGPVGDSSGGSLDDQEVGCGSMVEVEQSFAVLDRAPVVHPVMVPGAARRYWVTEWVLCFVFTLGCLAVVWWCAVRPPSLSWSSVWLVGAVAGLVGLRWLSARMGWLAWAEIPGAWPRRMVGEREPADGFKDRLYVSLTIAQAVLIAAGGVFIAGEPGLFPAALVGSIGGVMFAWRLLQGLTLVGRSQLPRNRDRLSVVRWLSGLGVALVWIAMGDLSWALQGALFAVAVLMWALIVVGSIWSRRSRR